MSEVLLVDSVLLLLVTVCAVAIIEVRSLYAVAMLTSVYSLLMALVWTNMHSMDVAFTEAAVGGGISTILLIGTLVHTRRDEKPAKKRLHVPALLVTILTGAALIYGTFDMPRFGDPNATIHHYRVPEMMAQNVGFVSQRAGKQTPPEGFVPPPRMVPTIPKADPHHGEHAEAEHHEEGGHHKHPADDFNGHVPNSVTSLLAAYRGYDTMFETTVIFTAGISLILLLRRRRDDEPQAGETLRGQVILRVMTKMFIPFILVFGFYVITHGEIGPGGGFQGGVILATAFILYALIYGRNALFRIIQPKVLDVLAAVGVLLYAGVGVACLLLGGKFLDYSALNTASPGDGEALGMTLVEYGVGITVCTVMIIIFNQLAEQAEAKAS
ncbi:MAG: Na(+)/H(+) antiporter subunit B [Myxococcales bacterium]|nr:Na(+)/H(+) antiporter subunit B [Myxococcales bacterium]MCB9569407.1 Na(+)/H(+) antiporter subunit B [Myxococcales bacterium]MCB9702359.1 Na(+)/H(+) antiporter subunit B [Myxococcales bacterium]